MAQRLDKWLVYARFVKHRSTAADLITEGHVRLNRNRVEKPGHNVKQGDVLTLALHGTVRVVKVVGEAERRSSAPEARLLYQDLMPAPDQPQPKASAEESPR